MISMIPYEWEEVRPSLLDGELPTNCGCGLVHPSDLHGIFGAGQSTSITGVNNNNPLNHEKRG